nr:phage/plasmid replication protein, II/X family [Rhodoferax sp.]
MIDFINITIDGDDFPKIGKSVTTLQPSGAETHSLTEVKVRSASGAPDFTAEVETRGEQPRMRFSGSPAKWIQGHNGMGSNDFQAVVKASVLLVFQTLGIDCPASVFAALSSGEYDVHEVHVAEHYRLPRGLIPKLCDNIRRHADSSLKAVPMEKGIGIRLWPDSRDLSVAIYDKYNYFLDRLCRHKFALMGNMPADFQRIGIGMDFDQMMGEYLARTDGLPHRHGRDRLAHGHAEEQGFGVGRGVERGIHDGVAVHQPKGLGGSLADEGASAIHEGLFSNRWRAGVERAEIRAGLRDLEPARAGLGQQPFVGRCGAAISHRRDLRHALSAEN